MTPTTIDVILARKRAELHALESFVRTPGYARLLSIIGGPQADSEPWLVRWLTHHAIGPDAVTPLDIAMTPDGIERLCEYLERVSSDDGH